jgi:release factor glutamine methyltransferase
MSDRVWRLMELINTSTQYLEGKGIESPRRNAEALLGKILNLPRIELYLQHDRPLTPQEVDAYRELIRRRSKHEPLQLLLGSVEFDGVRLEVVPGLLIPRPETEQLVERAAQFLSSRPPTPCRILDIGTGTGCIAVALASRFKNAQIDAVDISFDAIRCAERNAEANGLGSQVHGILVDIFDQDFPNSVKPPYDIIVSNPPYISEQDYATLAAEVRDHEPKQALVAAENGLAFYRRLADLLPTLLSGDGLLAVEIGYDQAESVPDLFHPVCETVDVGKDLSGIPRIVSATLKPN